MPNTDTPSPVLPGVRRACEPHLDLIYSGDEDAVLLDIQRESGIDELVAACQMELDICAHDGLWIVANAHGQIVSRFVSRGAALRFINDRRNAALSRLTTPTEDQPK
jgi:hypothetical protein